MDILRNNEKNRETQAILDQIDVKDAQKIVPNYKFKKFKRRIKELEKAQLKLIEERKKEENTNKIETSCFTPRMSFGALSPF